MSTLNLLPEQSDKVSALPRWLTHVLAVVACLGQPAMGHTTPVLDAGLDSNTVSEAIALRDAAIRGTQAFQWVEKLTTEVGPRLAGSDAEASAREWAVKELTGFGFDRVWVESFPLPGWERGLETGYVISPYPQPLTLTSLGGSVATPDEGVEGDVAIFTSLQALELAAPGSLDGK